MPVLALFYVKMPPTATLGHPHLLPLRQGIIPYNPRWWQSHMTNAGSNKDPISNPKPGAAFQQGCDGARWTTYSHSSLSHPRLTDFHDQPFLGRPCWLSAIDCQLLLWRPSPYAKHSKIALTLSRDVQLPWWQPSWRVAIATALVNYVYILQPSLGYLVKKQTKQFTNSSDYKHYNKYTSPSPLYLFIYTSYRFRWVLNHSVVFLGSHFLTIRGHYLGRDRDGTREAGSQLSTPLC